MRKSLKKSAGRYDLVDALRGFSLLNMIAFHFLFDLFELYGLQYGWSGQPLTVIWERYICCSFIVISGIAMNFSHHGIQRGILANLGGFAITAITLLTSPRWTVWCGILTFFGCAMIVVHLLKPWLLRIPALVGGILSLLLFLFCYGMIHGYLGILEYPLIPLPKMLYQIGWLTPLGFPFPNFFSGDYFPFFPWIFLYLTGFFGWRALPQIVKTVVFQRKIPVLQQIGRHTFWVYLFHQPILYAVCFFIFGY